MYCSCSASLARTHRKLHAHTRWAFFSCFTIKFEPITPGVISKFIFYEPQPGGFSLHYFICLCVCFLGGGFLSLCSLDLIVFSLLLPRLSTSPPPTPPPKNTSLWLGSGVPYAQKRGTATEAETDDIHMAALPFKHSQKLRRRSAAVQADPALSCNRCGSP